MKYSIEDWNIIEFRVSCKCSFVFRTMTHSPCHYVGPSSNASNFARYLLSKWN